MVVDHSPASGFTRVFQGQESLTLRGSFVECNETNSSEKPFLWNPSLDDDKIDVSVSRRYEPHKWLPLGRPESSFTDLLSGFGSKMNSPRDFSSSLGDQGVSKRPKQGHEAKYSLNEDIWSMMPMGLSLNLMDSSSKSNLQGADTSYQPRGDVRYGSFGEFSMIPDPRVQNSQPNWFKPPSVSPYLQIPHPRSREVLLKSVFEQQHDITKPKEGNCKLFGIPLISNSAPSDSSFSHRNSMIESSGCMQNVVHSHQSPAIESDQRSDISKGSKVMSYPVATSEQENQFQSSPSFPRDKESKGHSGSTRSCTKVFIFDIIIFLPQAHYQ